MRATLRPNAFRLIVSRTEGLGARTFLALAAVGLLLGGLTGCGSGDASPQLQASIAGSPSGGEQTASAGETANVAEPVTLTAEPSRATSPAVPQANQFPEVLIQTSEGNIRVRLNAAKAPLTVENFLENYVLRGFYEQTIVHYVDDGFMIAAGGYGTDYQAKPTRTAVFNESDNGLSNRRGTVAMARHPEYAHSATSQFFINLVDNPTLDHQETEDGQLNGYCVFGEVIEGMEIVDRIAKTPVNDREGFPKTPTEPVVIQTMEVVKR